MSQLLRSLGRFPLVIGALALVATSPVSPLRPAESRAAAQDGQVATAVSALKRLKGVDLETNPALKAAVLKVLESTRGTPQFVELVGDFKIKGQAASLLQFAMEHPNESAGVEAIRLVLHNGEIDLVQRTLETPQAGALLQVLANTSERELLPVLKRCATDPQRDQETRKLSLRSLAQTAEGAEYLLELAAKSDFPSDLKAFIRAELRNSRWPEIKARLAEGFEGPSTGLDLVATLPPVAELAQLKGDPARGEEVFNREIVGCARCHQVRGRGVDFGPDLSEIGTKLAREAIYESILDPNAGISFGYEGWQLELKNGDEIFGLLSSETAEEITIKAQTGIVTRYNKDEVSRKVQQRTSVMPTGLAQTMSREDLVDLVEYLASLKKDARGHEP